MSIEKAREDIAAATTFDELKAAMLAMETALVARTEISRASAGGGDIVGAAVCFDCGLSYADPGFCDLVVPHDVWLAMSPTGHEGGLLCPTCMCRAARRAGLDKVTAAFRSGPFAPAQPAPASEGGEPVVIGYTNHRGEFAERRIHPMNIWYGSTKWHPEPQWFVGALDYDKGEHRDFALKDIVSLAATARIRELEELAETRRQTNVELFDGARLEQQARFAAEATLAALRERVNRAVSVLNITKCDETDRAQDIRDALDLLTDPAPATAQPARGDDSPVPAPDLSGVVTALEDALRWIRECYSAWRPDLLPGLQHSIRRAAIDAALASLKEHSNG